MQVSKEERGNKGAAMTSYLSLAGRYCVLMPNSPKGGGISRKISSPQDRNRLREILNSIEMPDTISLIIRTAGRERTKAEIKRDYDYLNRQWESIRGKTIESIAPTLVHEEANLIKRSIRDLYGKETTDILVEGHQGYQAARNFMKNLMPSHAKNIKEYKEVDVPLFQKYGAEQQIEQIHLPETALPSGGSIVINQTEALVAIDINSGRATRERNIEDTALKTNKEAAVEIARQLRLRDLSGLIVIDFIDMDDTRHNQSVESVLKQAMQGDRARIQIGSISPFGLLELSRQRLRPSIIESSTVSCPQCHGSGLIRSTESSALELLRSVEEEAVRKRSKELKIDAPRDVALYILNYKRDSLLDIEKAHSIKVDFNIRDDMQRPNFEIKFPAKAETTQKKQQKTKPIKKSTDVTETKQQKAEEAETASKKSKSRRRGRRGGRRRERSKEATHVETAHTTTTYEEQTKTKEITVPIPTQPAPDDDKSSSWWKRLLE